MKHKLLEIGEKAVRKAEELGAGQAEAFIASTRSFSINVENNSIKSANEKRDTGCGIRSVVNKKIGFAYVTTILEEDILEAAEKSVKLAKSAFSDPDFVSLPSYDGAYPRVKGLFDSAIEKLTSEEAANLIVRVVEATKEAVGSMKIATAAQLTATSGNNAVINSLGISGIEKGTVVFLYSYPTVKDNTKQTSSYEYQISRNLKTIDPEWIGQFAGKNALLNFGAKAIESGDMPVLIAPYAVSEIIGNGFGQAINAEEIQYGRSYIMDALGEAIASEELHIVDDAVRPGGIKSRIFDAEGFLSQRVEILTSGVLKNILHNSYTANKDEVDNTGNASRASYSGVPSVSPSNLVISPGKGTQEDLISEIGKGILCRDTGDEPNMVTGELSAMVMEGYYIENGEIKHPLKNTLIGINMKDLLQKVHRIGNDVRVTTDVISPSIIVETAKITSG
ncbi:MAG: TldD/PmbA family protein [Candidatus Hodarchaeota archaeon]